ncbi:MAG TPA: hypothetical protein DCQ06_09895 [Myxococcales bacterium]|nr:hypothetical protein [Myxococcales bacterium]
MTRCNAMLSVKGFIRLSAWGQTFTSGDEVLSSDEPACLSTGLTHRSQMSSVDDHASAVPLGRGSSMDSWSDFRQSPRNRSTLFGKKVPFVGRREEMESVYGRLRDALNSSAFRVVWLHGGSGLGKSRLFKELRRAVAPQRRGVAWHEISTSQTDRGPERFLGKVLYEVLGGEDLARSVDPWSDALRQVTGLVGERYAAECMSIVGRLIGLVPPQAETIEPYVSNQSEREQAEFHVAASLLRTRCRQGPVVLRVDVTRGSVHEVARFIQEMVSALDGVGAACLVESRVPAPQPIASYALELVPLAQERTHHLARQLLRDVQQLPQQISRELSESCRGNPERLLEMIRGLMASGDIRGVEQQWTWQGGAGVSGLSGAVDASGLPFRLAQLDPHLRHLLAIAAVFGRTFWFGGILSVLRSERGPNSGSNTSDDRVALKQALLQLQDLEIISFVADGRLSQELEFVFQQVNDHKGLVAAIGVEQRQTIAILAAQWLAIRPKINPIADAAKVARLYHHGGRPRLAAVAFGQAGQAALKIGQLQRATTLFGQGAALVQRDDSDVAADLHMNHGESALRLGDHKVAEDALMQARHYAECLDDARRAGKIRLRLGQVARLTGRYDLSIELLHQSLKKLRIVGAHKWIAEVMDELGLVYVVRGGADAYRQALAYFLKGLALRRRAQDRRVVARSLCHIATVQLRRGHFKEALDAAEEGAEICEQIIDQWGLASALMALGDVQIASGRARHALSSWKKALDFAVEVGDALTVIALEVRQAEGLIAIGRWQDAAAAIVETLDAAVRSQDPVSLSGVYRVRAAISLQRDALETADLDSMRAVEVAEQSGARFQVALAMSVRGCVLGTRALNATSEFLDAIDTQARQCFDTAVAAYNEMGDLVNQLSTMRSYEDYLSQRGNLQLLAQVELGRRALEDQLQGFTGNLESTTAS